MACGHQAQATYYVPRSVDESGSTEFRGSDMWEWAQWFKNAHQIPFTEGGKVVARDELPGSVCVSTVFLGLDHSFSSGPPVLFETMIFGGPHSEDQERYCTYHEALAGHARALALAKGEST